MLPGRIHAVHFCTPVLGPRQPTAEMNAGSGFLRLKRPFQRLQEWRSRRYRPARRVTDLDISALRPDGLSRDGQSQAEPRTGSSRGVPRTVGTGPRHSLEARRTYPAISIATRPSVAHTGIETSPAPRRVFEGIAQQVGHGRREQLLINLDPQPGGDRLHSELQPVVLGLELSGGRDVVEQIGYRHDLRTLVTCGRSNI